MVKEKKGQEDMPHWEMVGAERIGERTQSSGIYH